MTDSQWHFVRSMLLFIMGALWIIIKHFPEMVAMDYTRQLMIQYINFLVSMGVDASEYEMPGKG